MIKFKIYVGWAGIAERPLNKWVSPRISLFAIDLVEGQVQLVICPLRALIRFLVIKTKSIYSGEAFNILRFGNFSSLSYSVINFLPWSPHVPKAH